MHSTVVRGFSSAGDFLPRLGGMNYSVDKVGRQHFPSNVASCKSRIELFLREKPSTYENHLDVGGGAAFLSAAALALSSFAFLAASTTTSLLVPTHSVQNQSPPGIACS